VARASKKSKYDVVVVGGGHNGLVAASYLAQAGLSTLLLERKSVTGGAAVSATPFAGLPAKLSRYAYLVSLLPDQIAKDLGVDVEFKSRRQASFTPTVRNGKPVGLSIERTEGKATRDSFAALTGSDDEYETWQAFYGGIGEFAQAIAPTFLEPLPTTAQLRGEVNAEIWSALVEQPIGATIEALFQDDLVRGVVATDALIGTFSDLHDPRLVQNRCFLYHLLGNGTGEWRVPVGGMGEVSAALERAAWRNGVEIVTEAFVTRVETDGQQAMVFWSHDGIDYSVECDWVLSNVAPWVLDLMTGTETSPRPEGAQMKVNMLVERLPRLISGASSTTAFSGTFHVNEGYFQLQAAFSEAESGRIPVEIPGELYCHSLTDPTILGPLAMRGLHTLTYFGLHTPARLFTQEHDRAKDEITGRMLDAINAHIEEPIESLLALDENDVPCLEVKSPLDIEEDLAMPGGHIFHGDLAWPWVGPRARMDTAAERWGVETEHANILMCGSGARRGGAVSGIAGHNAAHALLDHLGKRG
jgi:phytoene dehydrogenase-like protein